MRIAPHDAVLSAVGAAGGDIGLDEEKILMITIEDQF
jgi:hypothetical protein